MDVFSIIKALVLVVTIVIILVCAINGFYKLQLQEHMEPSFKQIIKYLLVSGLVSDMLCLLNLLLSVASGGWPLGFISCEIWGFAATTMLAFYAWLISTTVVERYFSILAPSEVPATFSHRNIRIIAVGMIFLIMMAAAGPFYGFGEYTYLRGYFNVLVSTNLSLPLALNQKEHSASFKLDNLHQLFSHLKHSSYTSPSTSLLSIVTLHIQQHYDVIVGKAKWLPHGILFSVRALSSESLDIFMKHYRDLVLTKNITDLSVIEDVAKTLNISDTELTANISMTEYYNYRSSQLPVQDMGICTADFTSPNHHASIWTGFYVSVTFILPYFASLAGLCLIYIRGFGYNSLATKRASNFDVAYTNITSSICMLTCVLNLFYFVTILSSDDGSAFNPSIVFWASYIFSFKTLPLVATLRFGSNMCNCYCTCFKDCLNKLFKWKSSKETSYELNDLEILQSLTGKQKKSNVVT